MPTSLLRWPKKRPQPGGKRAEAFVAARPFADPEATARKLVEIANAAEAVQDGRIHIELVNLPFLDAGGTAAEFRAGIERAVANGWLGVMKAGPSCGSHRPVRTYSRDSNWNLLGR